LARNLIQKFPTNNLSDPEHAQYKENIWRFAILLSKKPFPSHPALPASPKNPANILSDTEHQNPKNVHFLKFAHENPPAASQSPRPKTQDLHSKNVEKSAGQKNSLSLP
jgi:hypothetical protein